MLPHTPKNNEYLHFLALAFLYEDANRNIELPVISFHGTVMILKALDQKVLSLDILFEALSTILTDKNYKVKRLQMKEHCHLYFESSVQYRRREN